MQLLDGSLNGSLNGEATLPDDLGDETDFELFNNYAANGNRETFTALATSAGNDAPLFATDPRARAATESDLLLAEIEVDPAWPARRCWSSTMIFAMCLP